MKKALYKLINKQAPQLLMQYPYLLELANKHKVIREPK